jgi:hypothetical protein
MCFLLLSLGRWIGFVSGGCERKEWTVLLTDILLGTFSFLIEDFVWVKLLILLSRSIPDQIVC